MRLAYADPPYPGRAHLYRDHPDYAGEVDHFELIERLERGYDGWALSTSAEALRDLLPLCPPEARVLAWVKHTVTVSWEPLIVRSARKPGGVRDWIQVEPDSYQWREKPDSYVIGQKPEAFCLWMFAWLGAEPNDTLDDLFPGSGNVARAWDRWRDFVTPDMDRAPRFAFLHQQPHQDRKRMSERQIREATPGVASVEAALRDRARHLLSLTKGWDSYGGEPLDPETVDKAVDVALALAHQFPTYPPQLVPCSDGSVQIEWHAGGWDAELWLMKHEPALDAGGPQGTPPPTTPKENT